MAKYQIDFEFVALPQALFRCGLDASAIAAYGAIRSLAPFATVLSDISDTVAATAAGMSERAYRDARNRLRLAGWLTWERTGRQNQYTVHTLNGTHAQPVIRSADSADQSGNDAGPDRQIPPDASTSKKEPEVKKNKTTWLTPYGDVFLEVVGGAPPFGKMAEPMKLAEGMAAKLNPSAAPDIVVTITLGYLRNYLVHMIATGGAQYISFPKFAETFSQWRELPKPKTAGGKARPLAGLDQTRDLRDGMDDLRGRKKHA